MPNDRLSLQLANEILRLCTESGASADTQHEALSIAMIVASNAANAARPTSLRSVPAGA